MKKLSRVDQLYLVIIVILIVIAAIGFTSSLNGLNNIRVIGREIAPLIDACMEVKVSVTNAHLWFEETMTGYEDEDSLLTTKDELVKAKFYANAMLYGEFIDEGRIIPIQDHVCINEIEEVIILIDSFIDLSDERYENKKTRASDDLVLDERFDDIFAEIIQRTDRVENMLQEDMAESIIETERSITRTGIWVMLLFLVVCIIVYILFGSIQEARDSNPLSGLPGNESINKQLELVKKNYMPYSLVYVDLDNFKAFNDAFGFSRGDDVLKFTGHLLKKAIYNIYESEEFLGHVGGDDFVMIVPDRKLENLLDEIVYRFDQEVKGLYRDSDLEGGVFVAKDRNGNKVHYPIISISLAAVRLKDVGNQPISFAIEKCTEMKGHAKTIEGSSQVIYNPVI